MYANTARSFTYLQRAALLVASAALVLTILPSARADAPNKLNFQGYVSDSVGVPVDGMQAFIVGVYDQLAGGVLLYEEQHPLVVVDTGLFTLEIGNGVPTGGGTFGALSEAVFDQPNRYLELSLNGETFAPRRPLASVAFALHTQSAVNADSATTAADASALDGQPASDFQLRVIGSCPSGSAVRVIDQNGSVVCDADSDTTYAAGSGLALIGTTFVVDTATIQQRVTGSCPAGQSIRSIDVSGAVTCELDDDSGGDITGVTAGSGLSGGGTAGNVTVDIASSGVDATHIATGAVGSDEIADNSITELDAKLAISGSGTATTNTNIRRFYLDELNGWSKARVRVVCNGEGQGSTAVVGIYSGGAPTPIYEYTCLSGGGRPWTYLSPAFDIVQSGSIDVRYRLTGGGRFFWREVSLVQAAEPFVVTADDNTNAFLTNSCANHAAGNITVDVPGPGTVVVNSNVWIRITHTVGTRDETLLVHDTLPGGGCSDWPNVAVYSIPASYPSSAGEIQTVNVRRMFSVAAAGSLTIYLNARQSAGFSASTDNLWWVGTDATFHPE